MYASYQTPLSSVNDVKYLVFHKGGVTELRVNQKIGSGTWIYLGTFEFDGDSSDYGMVVLSNESNEGRVVYADVVRFDGGAGDIARDTTVSGLSRYPEGARYSVRWAGISYDIYGRKQEENDYTDDVNACSNIINYLSGGSIFSPVWRGLGVPLEINVALYNDTRYGKVNNIVGSLGIYTVNFNNGLLGSGSNRYAFRDPADLIPIQTQKDIRANSNIQWA